MNLSKPFQKTRGILLLGSSFRQHVVQCHIRRFVVSQRDKPQIICDGLNVLSWQMIHLVSAWLRQSRDDAYNSLIEPRCSRRTPSDDSPPLSIEASQRQMFAQSSNAEKLDEHLLMRPYPVLRPYERNDPAFAKRCLMRPASTAIRQKN